jgi:murein DD-endopeptidase MepM/ murein hydrolase activator NlpD
VIARPAASRLAAACLAIALGVAPATAGPRVVFTPERPAPGDIVLVRVEGAPPDLGGQWHAQPLRFFPAGSGLAALVGVDLDVPPGPLPWTLTRPGEAGQVVIAQGAVTVQSRAFATQHLTLPKAQVDLDAATLARVRAERTELDAALASGAGERLWRGAFLTPVADARPGSGFGFRRIINGQPRSPHTGVDWAAPRGTPVMAANAGRVALVAEHFFSGRLVVLDHGLGLFTHYYHLDESRVAAGQTVTRGQPIGAVGATGRATGPHLHFGVTLGGARVDPAALLGLALPPDPHP